MSSYMKTCGKMYYRRMPNWWPLLGLPAEWKVGNSCEIPTWSFTPQRQCSMRTCIHDAQMDLMWIYQLLKLVYYPLWIVIWTEITTFLQKMVINHHHRRLWRLIWYGVIKVLSGLMCRMLLMEVVGLIPNPLVYLHLLGWVIVLLEHPVRDIGQLLQAIIPQGIVRDPRR